MALNARTATAKDFDKAAQKHANATWFWVILAAIIFYFFVVVLPLLFSL